PTLLTTPELKSNTQTALAIKNLCNQAFSRHKALDPEKWNTSTLRFPDLHAFYAMLTPESIVAVIFGDNNQDGATKADNGAADEITQVNLETKSTTNMASKIIACAAAVPWAGGWSHEGRATESGFEIKIVCVDAHPRYLHKGLAVYLLGALERHLIEVERARLRAEGVEDRGVQVQLWILAAECINGVYWRKRGYEKVRSKVEGAGVWSCKTSFEMGVFRKVV
ncbi:hypothetical protein T440DRAFT_374227, partial [Plenodomus tracheiphilus IPT5]